MKKKDEIVLELHENLKIIITRDFNGIFNRQPSMVWMLLAHIGYTYINGDDVHFATQLKIKGQSKIIKLFTISV